MPEAVAAVVLHQILQQLVRLVELAAAVEAVIIQTEMESQEAAIPVAVEAV